MIDMKYEALTAVYEEKNFTKAAERLNLTQPAVSHMIASLEAELKTQLFIRKRGEITPTKQGEIAVNYARRYKATYSKMLTEIADCDKNISALRIGVTHTSEKSNIAETIAKFSMEKDGLKITVITDTIKNLYSMLENCELDLAIVDSKPSSPNLYSLMIDTDYLVCIVAPEHRLADKPMVTLNELKKEKMILRLPSSATRMLFDSTLESIGDSINNFNIILEVDNIATIIDLVRKELGISIIAKSACLAELKKKKLVALPIENLSMARETNIIYNKDFGNIELLRELVNAFRK